jgi:hypothetical protein
MLPIVKAVEVVIVGAPVACGAEVKDTWRDLSAWVGGQLQHTYGDAVRVVYFDLFEPGCPPLPPDASELPVVLVGGKVASGGGKLSVPLIRCAVEAARDIPSTSVPSGTD